MADEWLETQNFPLSFIAAGGLVEKDGRVLLIKSERRGWEFPGGVVEKGESVLQGLKREIREESGVISEPVALVGIYQNLALKKGYGKLKGTMLPPSLNIDFICRWTGGEAKASEEGAEVKWFAPEEAREAVRYPGYKERLKNMLDFSGKISLATYKKTSARLFEWRESLLN